MQTGEKIQVLLAMDKNLFSQGLRLLLERQVDISMTGHVETVAQLTEQFQQSNPHVVLMDVTLEGADTSQPIKELKDRFPSAAVLIISNSEGSEEIYRALRAGVRGYISTNVDDGELIHAIRRIQQGRNYLSAAIANKLAERMNRSTLSEREMQVLQFIIKGKSNKEIGEILKVTEPTVKYHVQSIMTKLGVTDRTEAATEALLRGIIRFQDL